MSISMITAANISVVQSDELLKGKNVIDVAIKGVKDVKGNVKVEAGRQINDVSYDDKFGDYYVPSVLAQFKNLNGLSKDKVKTTLEVLDGVFDADKLVVNKQINAMSGNGVILALLRLILEIFGDVTKNMVDFERKLSDMATKLNTILSDLNIKVIKAKEELTDKVRQEMKENVSKAGWWTLVAGVIEGVVGSVFLVLAIIALVAGPVGWALLAACVTLAFMAIIAIDGAMRIYGGGQMIVDPEHQAENDAANGIWTVLFGKDNGEKIALIVNIAMAIVTLGTSLLAVATRAAGQVVIEVLKRAWLEIIQSLNSLLTSVGSITKLVDKDSEFGSAITGGIIGALGYLISLSCDKDSAWRMAIQTIFNILNMVFMFISQKHLLANRDDSAGLMSAFMKVSSDFGMQSTTSTIAQTPAAITRSIGSLNYTEGNADISGLNALQNLLQEKNQRLSEAQRDDMLELVAKRFDEWVKEMKRMQEAFGNALSREVALVSEAGVA